MVDAFGRLSVTRSKAVATGSKLLAADMSYTSKVRKYQSVLRLAEALKNHAHVDADGRPVAHSDAELHPITEAAIPGEMPKLGPETLRREGRGGRIDRCLACAAAGVS